MIGASWNHRNLTKHKYSNFKLLKKQVYSQLFLSASSPTIALDQNAKKTLRKAIEDYFSDLVSRSEK